MPKHHLDYPHSYQAIYADDKGEEVLFSYDTAETLDADQLMDLVREHAVEEELPRPYLFVALMLDGKEFWSA